jgi:hypothetical protein
MESLLSSEKGTANYTANIAGATGGSNLPDPLTKVDGTKIMKKSDWRCRKAEIRQLADKSGYGEKKWVRPRQGQSLTL